MATTLRLAQATDRTRWVPVEDGGDDPTLSRAGWSLGGPMLDVSELLPDDRAELLALLTTASDDLTREERAELLAATEPIPFHGPSVLKFGYCEQRTYENVSLALLERHQPDLAMVFLIAVDPVSHTFWHYFEPEKFEGVPADDAARLGPIVPAMYEHDDRTLARLLELVAEDTVVIIVSDHGFDRVRGRVLAEDRGVRSRFENVQLGFVNGVGTCRHFGACLFLIATPEMVHGDAHGNNRAAMKCRQRGRA